jgi:hypothetical protein
MCVSRGEYEVICLARDFDKLKGYKRGAKRRGLFRRYFAFEGNIK